MKIIIFLLILISCSLCPNILQKPIWAEELLFMGETITAPGYYPGVPNGYVSVLDDLYLHGELSLKYSKLNYDGKISQEIMSEFENLHEEIRSRGHLPYPGDGLGRSGGYALVDLDDDGSSELIILDNAASYGQVPVIKSIFAIRNGRLVCIDDGSFELNYSFLANDKTFYTCIDWNAAGYTDLSAFRLEAGMTEFTITEEAHAALSFSGGDVPEPYWFEIEDGIERLISEDKFNLLMDKYENLKEEPLPLNFVPLHTDVPDAEPILNPDGECLPGQIVYPINYQGAPEAYKPILDALFLLGEHMKQEEYGYGDYLDKVGFAEYPYPRDSMLGYALCDLNGDGVLEMLLGSVDDLNASAPSSIFVLKDGQPLLLASFWARNRGVIAADTTIYNIGSWGAAYTYLSSFRLSNNSDALTQLTYFASDYSFSDSKAYYYKVLDGKNHYIPEEEFFGLCELYDNPPERIKLTVMPVNNEQK